jgi:hypothetical protein
VWFGVQVAIVQVPSPTLNVVDILTKLSPRSMSSTLNVEAVQPPKIYMYVTLLVVISHESMKFFSFVRVSKLRIQINSVVFYNILVYVNLSP